MCEHAGTCHHVSAWLVDWHVGTCDHVSACLFSLIFFVCSLAGLQVLVSAVRSPVPGAAEPWGVFPQGRGSGLCQRCEVRVLRDSISAALGPAAVASALLVWKHAGAQSSQQVRHAACMVGFTACEPAASSVPPSPKLHSVGAGGMMPKYPSVSGQRKIGTDSERA